MVDKIEEFATEGDKNYDGLDISQGFSRSEKPERPWFNKLFYEFSKTINNLVDAINGLSEGVEQNKLDTNIIVTPKNGGVERTQAGKNSEVVSINDFYDRDDNDYTEAFKKASVLGCNVIIPRKKNNETYKVTGSIELKNGTRFLGAGNPVIDLYLTDTYDRGFWLRESNCVLHGVTINKYQSATNGDGRWLNSICINDFGDGQNLVAGCQLSNIAINDVGAEKHNTIGIYGNTSHVLIENVTVNGNGTYSLMIHWGYNTPFTNTYHPRHITIRNFCVNGDIDVTYGIYVSAGHDITIERTMLSRVTMGIVVAAGEYGGLYADEPSKGKVLSGMVIDGVNVEGIRNDLLYISARGNSRLRPEKLKERWHGLDENINLAIRDVTLIRDADTYSGQVRIEHFKNLTIDGLHIKNLPDAEKITTLARILITEGVDIDIKNADIDGAKGIEIESGRNIKLDGNLICSHPAPNSVTRGMNITGTSKNMVTGGAVAIGDSQITISQVTENIYNGQIFSYNGQFLRFAGSWHVDTETPTNNANRVIKIEKAKVSIPSGATIKTYRGVDGLEVKGLTQGFYTNYVQNSDNDVVPCGIDVGKVTFDTSYQFHATIDGGNDVNLDGSVFKNGNTAGSAGISNVRVNKIKKLHARKVVMDKDYPRVNFGFHIITADEADYSFDSCEFYNLLSGTRGAIYSNYPNIAVRGNYYADSIRSVGVMPNTVVSYDTVGTKRIAESSAAPVSGKWNVGDIAYARTPTAGGNVGWVCTVAGTAGTWKTFGNISA